jgi:serine/threonine-protein kinase
LKIPALVLVVGFVVYLLWRGITSLPINSDSNMTETISAQIQTFAQETIAVQLTSMSAAETIAAQATSTRVAETIAAKSAAETMVVIQTESARPTETPVPTLTLAIGSTMTGNHGETLVYVPKGEFTMGNGDSNAPIHTVYLDAFWIDQFEVTNKQYQACVDAGTCESPSSKSSYTHPSYYENTEFDNYPVLYVNWDKANRYCEVWAGGDLPTEAQWEKAASWDETTQTQRVYPWGDSIDCSFGNFYDTQNNKNCIGDTTPVGSYDSGKSPYGAYDMAGNVWEWVNDYYQSDYYIDNAINPQGPTNSVYRVLRGGSWDNLFNFARSAYRYGYTPDYANYNFGFRCARSLP